MRFIIIPCLNEGSNIERVIRSAEKSCADRIIVVDNGSEDDSLDIIKKNFSQKTSVLYVNLPMGHDIPRAMGLRYSLLDEGKYFIFLDADMIGVTSGDIDELFKSLESGVDLALTDCYCSGSLPSGLASYVMEFRKLLNKELDVFNTIKHASPSHGPLGISKKLAETIPIEYIGIPPLVLEYAVTNGFSVDIGLSKLHSELGSEDKDERHSLEMAETIVGDCVYALKSSRNNILNRWYDGIEYTGFNPKRRFDILELIIENDAPKT